MSFIEHLRRLSNQTSRDPSPSERKEFEAKKRECEKQAKKGYTDICGNDMSANVLNMFEKEGFKVYVKRDLDPTGSEDDICVSWKKSFWH